MKIGRQIIWTGTILLTLIGFVGTVDAANLSAIRATNDSGRTRIVLDLDAAPTGVRSSYNKETNVVTLTLHGTQNTMKQGIQYKDGTKGLLKGVNLGAKGKDLQVSLNTLSGVQYNTFSLVKPNRVVVDLFTDYAQKTNREIKSGVEFTKWDTSTTAGHVKAYVFKISGKEPMRVGQVGKGKTLSQVEQPVSVAVGVQEVGSKKNGPVELIKGTSIIKDTQLSLMPTLRHVNGSGYSIKFNGPALVAESGSNKFPIQSVNRDRAANSLVLYTPMYGASTRTNVYGYELVINNGVVSRAHNYDTPLKAGEMVLSGHGTMGERLKTVPIGSVIRIVASDEIAKVSQVGEVQYKGGSAVLNNGFYIGPKESPRVGRSFIGATPDGGLLVMVVDYKGGESVGVTTEEGVKLLKTLGARQGLELLHQNGVDMLASGKIVYSTGSEKLYSTILVFP